MTKQEWKRAVKVAAAVREATNTVLGTIVDVLEQRLPDDIDVVVGRELPSPATEDGLRMTITIGGIEGHFHRTIAPSEFASLQTVAEWAERLAEEIEEAARGKNGIDSSLKN